MRFLIVLFFLCGGFIDTAFAQAEELAELKQSLSAGACDTRLIRQGKELVQDSARDVRVREEILQLLFTACGDSADFTPVAGALLIAPDLEWYLREQAILFDYQKSLCSGEVQQSLMDFFYETSVWPIRNAVVWVLSNTAKNCDSITISFLSDFIQRDTDGVAMELLDFRQHNIQSVLWALVRLGIKNQNPLIVTELKNMAMKYDMNIYFRIRAVEALQDLSLYMPSAAQALYEIVRDNKRIARSEFVTYEQRIRDEQDTQVRDVAFIGLVELVNVTQTEFLPFLSVHREKWNADQLYRNRAFAGREVPEDMGAYARLALEDLQADPQVLPHYRKIATDSVRQ